MPDPLVDFLNISAIDRQQSRDSAGSRMRENPDTWKIDFSSSNTERKPVGIKYDPNAQILVSRQFDLAVDKEQPTVVNPINTLDGQHAVLLIREAPDTSYQSWFTHESGLNNSIRAVNDTSFPKEAKDGQFRAPAGVIKFATDDFLLQSVQEQDSERVAPSYTLRGVVIRTSSKFGRTPRIYGYTGTLISNDVEKSSMLRMLAAWDQYLRATSCIVDVNGNFSSRGTPLVAELLYRDQVRRGYLMSMQLSVSASFENTVALSLQLFVTEAFSRSGPAAAQGTT